MSKRIESHFKPFVVDISRAIDLINHTKFRKKLAGFNFACNGTYPTSSAVTNSEVCQCNF